MPAKVRAPITDALPRERLEAALAGGARRLALVIAPAGSGKTTLLARFAARSDAPVAWYRAEALDRDESTLVRHLEASLRGAAPGLPGAWQDVDDVVRALDAQGELRVSLVVDDFHALEGSAAEAAFARLVEYAPASLTILLGTRVAPGLNLSRMRVAGDLLEIGPDDLRFRSWEAEALYREVYRDPVPPGILAELTRRTEGWAAGLKLFHLASAGKPVEERRRLLAGVGGQGRMVREYLAGNVLAELPDDLRQFLVDTCVLRRLSGPLCDRLLGTTGSADLLDELVRRGVFTVPVEEGDGLYRYHEVLRGHLDRLLVVAVGEEEARRRHARAAALLEADGALAEALTAWSRAEDWPEVDRLLRLRGERLVESGHGWVEGLPASLVRHEPWLMLAAARQARAAGRWGAALEWYARAEAGFGAAAPALACRQERTVLAAWLDPDTPMPPNWTSPLRAALAHDPAGVARTADVDDVHRGLVRGLAWLAAGRLDEAARWLRVAREEAGLAPVLDAGAALALAALDLLAGRASALAELAAAVELAEHAGAPWLAQVGRAVAQRRARVSASSDGVAGDGATMLPDGEDPWGAGLAALAGAWCAVPPGRDAAPSTAEARTAAAESAAVAFRQVGAGVLESWARALAALGGAEAGVEAAREAALGAEALARSTGTIGARLPVYLALERADPARADDYRQLAAGVTSEFGLILPAARDGDLGGPSLPDDARAIPVAPDDRRAVIGSPEVRIATLGGFVLTVDGRPVDLSPLKPRARSLLHMLAIHAPGAVHREVLQTALWPDADAPTGARSLQVGVSAIRGVLAGCLPEGDGSIALVREGDAYRLAIPDDALDLRRLERALAAAREAEARGEAAAERYTAVLEQLDAELLPEDGPADWVVERREQLAAMGVAAAVEAARSALAMHNHEAATRACRAGLRIDRYHDPLWRLLIETHDRAGDAGAASRDRRQYEHILAGLGVPAEARVGSSPG